MKKLGIITTSLSTFMLSASSAFAAATDINLVPPSGVPQAPSGLGMQEVVRFVISLLIVAGIIAALIFLILGAIQWIISGGDKQKVEAARGHIVAAIIGLVIIVLAIVIFNFIGGILGAGDLTNLKIPSLRGIGTAGGNL